MKQLHYFIGLLLICGFTQCTNAQNKKTDQSALGISDFQLSKQDISSKEVHFTNLGQFASDVAGSKQGIAIYGDYLVQAHDKAGVAIFDIPSHKVVATGKIQPYAPSNHCNNICFSDRFYHKTDQFPLLYVSENRTSDIAVNRLASLDSSFELVQHITLPEKIGYFLNAVFDFQHKYIYTICYKEKNWRTNDGNNHIIVSKLRLPDISEGDVAIKETIEQFDIPFRTATQGAFYANGYIVHGFGINKPDKQDALVIIDPSSRKVARVIDTHDVFHDEIEGVTPYGDSSIVVALQHGDVYSVDFE